MHLQCNFITRYAGIRFRIYMNLKKMARPLFNRQSMIKMQTYPNEKTQKTQDRHVQGLEHHQIWLKRGVSRSVSEEEHMELNTSNFCTDFWRCRIISA